MTNLQHPDTLHLQAAIGWLELGNHLEANEELEKITASLRTHPDVLVVRWRIYAKAEKWEGAFEVARKLGVSEWLDLSSGSVPQNARRRSRTSLGCTAPGGR